jgi:RHS repeat-associated protein
MPKSASYSGNVVADFNYEYDAVGNMTAYIEVDEDSGQKTDVTRVFNAANQLISSYDGTTTTTYHYDNNGNLLTSTSPGIGGGHGQGYAYNQRNLLIIHSTIGMVNQLQAAFVYDGDGNRAQQVDHTGSQPITTTYTNDNSGLSQVLVSDDGTTKTTNLLGLSLIQQDDGAIVRTLLADRLGSVRVEMVGNAIDSTTTYEPYGKLLARTGTSGTVYGYTGEQYDGAAGLVYLRARYYNPNLKLFMSRDPFPGWQTLSASQHGYSYVHNNPVNLTDPSGEFVPAALVAAAAACPLCVLGGALLLGLPG